MDHVPKAFWVGLVLFALAFVVNLSTTSRSSSSAGASCSYTDIAALGFAAAIIICIAAAWQDRKSRHPARRLNAPAMFVFSAVLVALAVVHVLRGTGTLGGPCG